MMTKDTLKKILSYPIDIDDIVDCVLRTQNELNEAFNIKTNPNYYWTAPKNDSTEWGCLYENEFRRRMNKLSDQTHLTFNPGEHNTGEDLTCVENPEFSIEIKTTQSTQFWNTNSRGRKQKSTKYDDPNHKCYYILIKHHVDVLPDGSLKTQVNKILFGMLSKNDWHNPKGSGAAYLRSKVRDDNCIEIYNDKHKV